VIGEQESVRNSRQVGGYGNIYRLLRDNHLEFTVSIPEHNIRMHVDLFQQVGVEGKDFTISVLEEASEMFFDWIDTKGFTITSNRRDHRRLSFYDIDYDTLNNQNIIDFTSFASGPQRTVNALYEAHHGPGNANAIFFGANRKLGNRLIYESTRATTIAHELAHWWLDYFKIYDRYYRQTDGTIDVERPAYEFERYFRTRYLRNHN